MAKKSAAQSDAKGAAARDASGKFLPGNGGGPGRPRREIEADYQFAFNKSLPPHKLSAVVGVVLQLALKGNLSAAKLLIEQSCGRASIRVSLDEPREEFRVAGIDPGETLRERMTLLRKLLTRRLEHEALVREQQAAVDPKKTNAPAKAPKAKDSKRSTPRIET